MDEGTENRRLDDSEARSKTELVNELAHHKISSENSETHLLHELQIYHAQLQRQNIELKKAQQLQQALIEENRALTQNLFNVQENERRHLARELHDELGQWLTAIQAEAEAISNSVAPASNLNAGAQAISDSARQMHAVIRGLLRQLRPAMLDALGLADSLRELQAQWCARHPNTQCDLQLHGDLENLSELINITVYRIIQEALTNVASHAHASHVRVQLSRSQEKTGDVLMMSVEDNGQGYSLEQKSKGLGLLGMRERTIAAGGEFALESTPGQGMHIFVRLPVTTTQPTTQQKNQKNHEHDTAPR